MGVTINFIKEILLETATIKEIIYFSGIRVKLRYYCDEPGSCRDLNKSVQENKLLDRKFSESITKIEVEGLKGEKASYSNMSEYWSEYHYYFDNNFKNFIVTLGGGNKESLIRFSRIDDNDCNIGQTRDANYENARHNGYAPLSKKIFIK